MSGDTGFGAVIKDIALKLAALFSYCGGPLFVADLLKPRFHQGLVFLLSFLPIGFMVVGAGFLDDPTRDRLSFEAIRAGRWSLGIVLSTHLYALWCFVNGVRVPDQSLHYLGITIGAAWSIAYLRAARRWSRPRLDGTEPIEPS